MDAAAAVVPICTGCGEVCSYAGCREADRQQENRSMAAACMHASRATTVAVCAAARAATVGPSSDTSRCVGDAVGPSLESDRGEMAVRRQRNGAGRERREPARRASPRSKELVDQREVIRVARSARTMGKISSAKYESSC